ncbi:hypothetical protein AMJ44_15765 [candidate division WOR-1 bacterium DG_54_3]|uniref:Uncharacterized protein n=1 Tax=candidate division WOR-1 bacterium DG_54_3 TaxID=1703775 RepID=A0A0S7XIU3_UNCSA|nr:MAG: hypothetical protein AMJ44_15765 [candidate division WOR-1 bacterium DG_54_3]
MIFRREDFISSPIKMVVVAQFIGLLFCSMNRATTPSPYPFPQGERELSLPLWEGLREGDNQVLVKGSLTPDHLGFRVRAA